MIRALTSSLSKSLYRSTTITRLRPLRTIYTIRSFKQGNPTMVKYINQSEAMRIDQELFVEYKFTLEQLMELAGQACAAAIFHCFPKSQGTTKILVLCGPGNNGGDGLVCARHLKMLGYKSAVYYPKLTVNPHYRNLLNQCRLMEIPVFNLLPDDYFQTNDLLVDALFGFSFIPPVRPEYQLIMDMLANTKIPICSIDIPSGWDVEKGCPPSGGIQPKLLVSLTAPKLCARGFKGPFHYLGGRFVPPQLAAKHQLNLPEFRGTEYIVDISEPTRAGDAPA